MRKQIAVIGSADLQYVGDIQLQLKELGRSLADNGCTVLAGSCGGVGNIVAQTVLECGGNTIAVSPCASREEHIQRFGDESQCFSSFIFAGSGFKARNVLLVQSADAVIAICGQIGTLNELTIAYDLRKPIGLLRNSGGVTDRIESIITELGVEKGTPIIGLQAPNELVKELLLKLSK